MALGWPHFSAGELSCPHCGSLYMDPAFMEKIELVRSEFGYPMIVSSAYRCPQHDHDIGGVGPHTTGAAMDILIYGEPAYHLLGLFFRRGFAGIGINQAKRVPYSKRFVHVDDVHDLKFPRPRVWSY